MKTKLKDILLIVLTACIVFGFLLWRLFSPTESYSLSERRVLAQPPMLTVETLTSGKFMEEFENFSLDQFPMRDKFRSTKALSSRYLFQQKENNGLYSFAGHLGKLEYPLNEARVERNARKLQEIYQKHLADTGCRVYFSIVPDKNYFLAPLGGYPTMDYAQLADTMRQSLDFADYIDIFRLLSLENYYHTDPHWKQETILPVAQCLAEAMGSQAADDLTAYTLEKPFYGAYYGQAALPFAPDSLCYLTNDLLAECTVTSYNTGKPAPSALYDLQKATGRDPYEMFLSGSDALLVVENPNAATDRELVVFRDSFGSSLVPLLVPGYAKVTLVDLRYLRSEFLGSFLHFDRQDVLFLYSTLVLNNTLSMN